MSAPARPAGSSMAARCTACSTVFRVVPDQLRVSEGWVRCGRCAEVFNAAENLIDLDNGTPYRLGADGVLGLRTAAPAPPTRWQPPVVRPMAGRPGALGTPPQAAQPAPQAPQAPGRMAHQRADATPHEQTLPFRREEADAARSAPALAPDDTRPPDPPAAPGHPDANDDWAPLRASSAPQPPADHALVSAEQTPWRDADSTVPPAAWAADMPDIRAAPSALPSFVRSADRAARWRRPQVRAGMAAVGVALLLLLGWQWLFSQRDLAAARYPLARAVLQPACAVMGCTLEPPRLIDSLSVESSGLLRVEKSDIYRLSVALRNRGSVEVSLPALELVLTDPQGQLVARRVLRTQELGATGSVLAAGKELALQATLQASAAPSTPGAPAATGAAVAGYTIELFYP